MLSVIMLSVIMLSVIMLSVIMLSIIMLSVITLSVFVHSTMTPFKYLFCHIRITKQTHDYLAVQLGSKRYSEIR
jgi:hypothetical protein